MVGPGRGADTSTRTRAAARRTGDRDNAASARSSGRREDHRVAQPSAWSEPHRGATVGHVPPNALSDAVRLRRPTLATAPFLLLGVIGGSVAVAVGLWGVWHPDDRGIAFWSVVAAGGVLVLLGGIASAGCFVEVRPDRVRDVVGWITVTRVERRAIRTVRVRAGAWRWFELELDDGTLRTLVGASPMQFPARLLPGSRERDLGDLDLLLGDDPS